MDPEKENKRTDNQSPGYKCPVCGFTYDTKELAQKCEAWCKAHNSCNLEITQYARENRNP